MENSIKKPPLGLFPRKLWEEDRSRGTENRIRDILNAISRYVDDPDQQDFGVTINWTNELKIRITELERERYSSST